MVVPILTGGLHRASGLKPFSLYDELRRIIKFGAVLYLSNKQRQLDILARRFLHMDEYTIPFS
eukprot:8561710-Heterocapsa_arctica.AAC.1